MNLTRRGFFGLMGKVVLAAALPINTLCVLGQQSHELEAGYLTAHYNRVFMKWLYANLNKSLMATSMGMPAKSGLQFRNFMHVPLEVA